MHLSSLSLLIGEVGIILTPIPWAIVTKALSSAYKVLSSMPGT